MKGSGPDSVTGPQVTNELRELHAELQPGQQTRRPAKKKGAYTSVGPGNDARL